MKPEAVLPDDVRQLPLEDKLKQLAVYSPEKVQAVDMLVTEALEDEWRKQFHAGPRGGLKLKDGR